MTLSKAESKKIKVGDSITFKLRWGRDASYMRKSTRRVTGLYHGRYGGDLKGVYVTSFVGCKEFYIEVSEILEIIKGGLK